MSGHSKWSNIKHRKEKTDGQKAKMFTKIGREIAVVVKSGGPDPDSNSKLKDIISKARSCNMPNENINRCIKKAAGEDNTDNFESIVYEGYGPSGVAVIVETLTDNRNRTAGEMRHYFDKYGGNLGQTGCVAFMFDSVGLILVEKTAELDVDQLMLDALECGANDVEEGDDLVEIYTDPLKVNAVSENLRAMNYNIESAQPQMLPQTTVSLTDEQAVKNMNKLIDALEDNDDVQVVYHNCEI